MMKNGQSYTVNPRDNESGDTGPPWWRSCRMLLALVGFCGFVNIYAQRVDMSVSIVCMVNHTAVRMLREAKGAASLGNSSGFTEAPSTIINATSDPNQLHCERTAFGNGTDDIEGSLVWEKELRGHILGAFFYGYLVSQVPAGLLAERYGGKWVFTGFVGLATVATLLTPLAANTHVAFLIFLRILIGVGSGGTFPVFHTIWSHWAPPLERSRLAGITYAGAMMGNVLSMPISGLLCKYGFAGGWPSIFYIFGMTSSVWLVVWIWFASDTPATHRSISSSEKYHIMASLKGQVSMEHSNKESFPWLKVAKSGPVWAIIIANITTDWGLYIFLTNIPTYLNEVLFFDIQSNSFLSALPFIGLWANMNISPLIADKLRASNIFSTTVVRKVFQSVGSMGAAAFLLGLAFVDCRHTVLAVVLLSLGVTITGCTYSGFLVNHMDIAPQFAGTLFGICNCIAACTGFIAPYIVAVITKEQTRQQWQTVFYISAAIYALGAIVYCLLGSGQLQPWAVQSQKSEDSKLNKIHHGELPDQEA